MEILPRSYARSRRCWHCDGITLLAAAARRPGPAGEPPEFRQALRERLQVLLEWIDRHLASPIVVTERRSLRDVVVFDVLVYRIDGDLRLVTPGYLHDGRFVPAAYSVELLQPLSTSWWLHRVIDLLCLSEVSSQADLFATEAEREWRDQWLIDAAYALLKRDPRFRLLRRSLHHSLALDSGLLRFALSARHPSNRGLSNEQYSRIWRHEDELRQVSRICPRLVQLAALRVIEGRESRSSYPLAALRSLFVHEHGLGRAAWRMVVRYGAQMFRIPWSVLRDGCSRIDAAAIYLGMLISAGVSQPPPPSLARAYLRRYGERIIFEGWHPDEPAVVLQIAFREADRLRQSPTLPRFIDDFLLVCEWAAETKPELDKAQRKAGWPWVLRQARAWEQRELLIARSRGVSWACPVMQLRHHNYEIHALCSAEALIAEGFAMRHCVYRYVDDCVKGQLRFFPVRDATTMKRVATLSLQFVPVGMVWLPHDIRGFANRPLKSAHRTLIEALLDAHHAPICVLERKTRSHEFDVDLYRAVKPSLEILLSMFQQDGQRLRGFLKVLVRDFGRGVRPYAVLFAREQGLLSNSHAAHPVVTEDAE